MGEKQLTIQEWLGTDDEACAEIVKEKYLIPKEILNREETMDEFLTRISLGNSKIKQMITERKFIPGGRLLAGIGMERYGLKVSLSNCYVLEPPKDSLTSIYETCRDAAITFSRGGGVGFDISNLAPRNAKVNNSAKRSSGAVSFMPTFSNVAEQVGQNSRRGAILLSIKDTHPDLEDFITHKKDLNLTNGANLSVMVSDGFMEAVKNDEMWNLTFHRPETNTTIFKEVKAKDIMRLIAQNNWEMGEPGMLFWDTFRKYNLMSEDPTFEYAGTNPCGEEPLPAGGACLLGSMNLGSYYLSENNMFDYDSFKEDVRAAIEYLDQVLSYGVQFHPLVYQQDSAVTYRQIGLGIMGLADLFIKYKFPYGSNESINLINNIGYVMAFEAIKASASLARLKGSFPACKNDKMVDSEFIRHNVMQNPNYSNNEKQEVIYRIKEFGLRNSALLTCAPTGTTSTIFNVSSGIEPMFAREYKRKVKTVYENEKEYIAHPKVIQDWLKENGYESMKDVKESDIPEYLVTAREIDWKKRLKMQSTVQSHIDASISSTINLPESTTVEEIENIYMYAYNMDCKGITVFRENCKRSPILEDTSKKKENDLDHNPLESVKTIVSKSIVKEMDERIMKDINKPPYLCECSEGLEKCTCEDKCVKVHKEPIKILTRDDMGEVLPGRTYKVRVACGHIYITINTYNNMPVEVFMRSSKSGGCAANTNALGRMASTMLRAGIPIGDIVDSIIGVKCDACMKLREKNKDIKGLSCADTMARILQQEYDNCIEYKKMRNYKEAIEHPEEHIVMQNPDDIKYNYRNYTPQENIDNGICPECGEPLHHEGGCVVCICCGFSLCS